MTIPEMSTEPNTKDLKLVANALLKMRDNNESIKSVFGLLEKTSHKTFDDVRLGSVDI
jgi:hypothetical protein